MLLTPPDRLNEQAQQAIAACADLAALELLRLQYLGKKGQISMAMAGLRDLQPQQRAKNGSELNQLKEQISQALNHKREALQLAQLNSKLETERLDVTLPGERTHLAHLHPLNITRRRAAEFFTSLGYEINFGPEIENDYYNFESLNFKPDHPARDMQDTFFLASPDAEGRKLLRTHTSNVQVRVMENTTPPVRTITMGRVYRCDSDVTHTPMFHQLECMLVDKNISLVHLKATLTRFVRYFFEQDIAVRLRPSFFPFTEPSAEVDIACVQCGGDGCRLCKHTGWIEILGSGLIHPNVLSHAGIDPKIYSGFAFGMGLERITMLRYRIDDLRLFFANDWDFLQLFH